MIEKSQQSRDLDLADELSDANAARWEQIEAAARIRKLIAEHEEDQSAIAVWRDRTQRAEAQRDALLAMLRESLQHAKWWDKHIHPFDGETFQNWTLSIHLPVKLSESDKSPEAALNRAIDAALRAAMAQPAPKPVRTLGDVLATLPFSDKNLPPPEVGVLPPDKKTRPDGDYRVLYRCQDCKHEQYVYEIVCDGTTYAGSGADWCDSCNSGLPVRVGDAA